MNCPADLLSFQFGLLFARFLQENPAVTPARRRVDWIAKEVGVAIWVRFPPLEKSDPVMRLLDESTQGLFTHPRLTPRELSVPAELTEFRASVLGRRIGGTSCITRMDGPPPSWKNLARER